MAGAYDDAPSSRMAWDADGTVLLYGRSDGTEALVDLAAGLRATLNNEESSGQTTVNAEDRMLVLLFPEARAVDGVFVSVPSQISAIEIGAFEGSGDATNGVDGTWSTIIADMPNTRSTYDNFRNEIRSTVAASRKGVRVHAIGSPAGWNDYEAFHVYGRISPGQTPDRILFLDTASGDAEFTKVLDFGDKARGQTTTRTFKIINNSSSKTINTIEVTAEDLYLNAGDWYVFGDDGVAYQATYTVGNLGPGGTKLIHLKQIIPDAETLGLQTGRILVSHDSVT